MYIVCVLCSGEQVALVTLENDVFEYTITNLDNRSPYVILVWVFSNHGDQEPARLELPPLGNEREREKECVYIHVRV